MNTASTTRHNTEKGRRDMVPLTEKKRKSHPNHYVPQWEGSQRYRTFPWGVRHSSSTLGILTFISGTGRDEPPKHLTLKTNGDYIQENYTTTVKGNSVPKGLMHGLTQIENQQENTRWKVHQPQVKETHLLILQWSPERQEVAGTLPRVWNTGGSHFCDLVLLCWCRY